MSVQHKMASVFTNILRGFDISFLNNAGEFNHGVTWRSELKLVLVIIIFALTARTLSGIRLKLTIFFVLGSYIQ